MITAKYTSVKSDYEYVMPAREQLGKHLGEWVAVVGDEIVASGEDAKEVYWESRAKYPDKVPFIMKIPKERVMLFYSAE